MRYLIVLGLMMALAQTASADDKLQHLLDQALLAARETNQLPAIAAVVQINGKIAAEAAFGVRAEGHPETVTMSDRWLIGSDTKAFTATLIARLVEQHVLSFDDTLAASFPSIANEMSPAYRNVTITQLLSHTAGLPPLTSDKDMPLFAETINSVQGVMQQRAAVVRKYLTMPPASKAGEFVYSNLGYLIAAAIAEAKTGKSWEDLIREQIFVPLGITNVGFGPPNSSGKFDEPEGHEEKDGNLLPVDPLREGKELPQAFGPAGTISIGLHDWMIFAQDQLDGEHGHGKLLTTSDYRKLHTPVYLATPEIQKLVGDRLVNTGYGLGWGLKPGPNGEPLLISWNGSDGYWLTTVQIMPKHNMIFLIVTNRGGKAGNQAIAQVDASLVAKLKPLD